MGLPLSFRDAPATSRTQTVASYPTGGRKDPKGSGEWPRGDAHRIQGQAQRSPSTSWVTLGRNSPLVCKMG